MAYDLPSPWEGAREYQQADASMQANARARQEMRDFYAMREALQGAGDETPYGAPAGYQRSNSLRRLFAVNPQAAIKYEQELLGPEISARKAGEVESAKLAERNKSTLALVRELADGLEEAPPAINQEADVPDGAPIPSVPARRRIRPIVKVTPQGPQIEFDPFKEEETSLGKEKLGLERTKYVGEGGRAEEKLAIEGQTAARGQLQALRAEEDSITSLYRHKQMPASEYLSRKAEIKKDRAYWRTRLPGGPGAKVAPPPSTAPAVATTPSAPAGKAAALFLPETEEQKAVTTAQLARTLKVQEADDKRILDAQEAGAKATESLANLERMDELINGDVMQGPLVGAGPGVTSGQQAFDAAASKTAFEEIRGMAAQIINTTPEQRAFYKQTVSRSNAPEVNREILHHKREIAQRASEYPDALADWQKRHGTMKGFEQSWTTNVNSLHSLIDKAGFSHQNKLWVHPTQFAQQLEAGAKPIPLPSKNELGMLGNTPGSQQRIMELVRTKLKNGTVYITPAGPMMWDGAEFRETGRKAAR